MPEQRMDDMREARIKRSSFDLRGFTAAVVAFLVDVTGKEIPPEIAMQAITPIDSDYRAMDSGESENRDVEWELAQGQGVFFPFSTTHIHNQPIMCANGRYYWLMDPWEGEEEADYYLTVGPDEEDDEAESDDIELDAVGSEGVLPMGELDYVGFLMKYEGDEVVVRTGMAVSSCGDIVLPIVTVREDCHIFEQPMVEFLIPFMAKGAEHVIKPEPSLEDFGGPLARVWANRATFSRDLWLN